MGPPVGFFAKAGRWEFPDDLLRTYKRDNLWLEVMYPISWGGVWDYPYPEAQALIRDLRDKLGAEKLVWGSDMPNVERFCTYTQSLDYVRRHCDFLTPHEKDRILGGNVANICGFA
jgi:predicted TIM-barrel fold metal-dependent hydrolase